MAIKYTVHETPKPNGREEEVLRHARAVCGATMKLDYICELISNRSSLSSADVKGVLDSFAWVMGFCLKGGNHVELEELGYFSPSLKTTQLGDGKVKVEVDGINYRCSTKLKDELRFTTLERVKETKENNPEKRKKIMLEYVERNGSISIRTYAGITGCSRYRADADFKRYLEEGVLVKVGYSNRALYLLP